MGVESAMKAMKLQLATRTLLNPAARQWAKVPAEEISLGGTPLHAQPTRYVRTTWAGKPLGAVRSVSVQAAHNGNDIAFRLEWADQAQELIAKGVGTTEESPKSFTQARASWSDGHWQVVFTRPLAIAGDGVQLSPKRGAKVAFAVWEGSHQERAGLKAFSKSWRELEIQ